VKVWVVTPSYSGLDCGSAHLGSVGLDAILIDHAQDSAPSRATDRVSSVRVEVQPLRQDLRHLRRRHHRCQRQPVADALLATVNFVTNL
jgi:hypothetical protein